MRSESVTEVRPVLTRTPTTAFDSVIIQKSLAPPVGATTGSNKEVFMFTKINARGACAPQYGPARLVTLQISPGHSDGKSLLSNIFVIYGDN